MLTHSVSSHPPPLGRYIALTGNTLGMGDLLYAGLATHAISLDDFTPLQQILMASEYDEHMEMNMDLHFPQPMRTFHSKWRFRASFIARISLICSRLCFDNVLLLGVQSTRSCTIIAT